MGKSARPTESELEILAVLWNLGQGTVREVMEAVRKRREVGYTTVLKLLQIMTEKGLVVRDERNRTHVYEPADPPRSMRRKLLADLVDRAFGGSRVSLVRALFDENESISREDFMAMYEQIEALRREEQDG